MAPLDRDVEVKVTAHVVNWTNILMLVCIAAVLIAGMAFGYECGCP